MAAELPSVGDLLELHDIPHEVFERLCFDAHLLKLSEKLTEWQVVTPYLGLNAAEEEEVRAEGGLPRQRLAALRKWKNKSGDKATYRNLIESLERARRADLIDELCCLLVNVPADSPDAPASSPLGDYGQYLKERYQNKIPSFTNQWPPSRTRKVFKLAMIKKKDVVQLGEVEEEFVEMTITGKVDDILRMKQRVELENILDGDDERRKVVLIEGAPGSGKSTLAWHVCEKWEKGELFPQYAVVILVQLRDPRVQSAQSIADLLPCQSEEEAGVIVSKMSSCRGRGMLWVLDGWDEVPLSLQETSLLRDLIQPPNCFSVDRSDVIVTSRPVSSEQLQPLASSRIEVIGFNPTELHAFFSECLEGTSQSADVLLDKVHENPIVEGSCYLPLNAAIMVNLFLANNGSLPSTLHGLFTSLVLYFLSRYWKERLGQGREQECFDSFETLPPELQELFQQICELAFSGVADNKITFTSADLKRLGISTKVSSVGLLQAVPSIVSDGRSVFYNFLHLSVQELLAAEFIAKMKEKKQISTFQELFGQPRFQAVLQFYAAITKFRTARQFLYAAIPFATVRERASASILDIVSSMIATEVSKEEIAPKVGLVNLLSCLSEVAEPSLCDFVAQRLNGKLNLQYTPLTPADCLSIGYFLSCINTTITDEFQVNFKSCSIGDHGCKFLIRSLSQETPVPGDARSWLSINLANNGISETGAGHIAEGLSMADCRISKLSLVANSIQDKGLQALFSGLVANSSLSELNVSKCALKSLETSCSTFCEMLCRNTTLRRIDFSCNVGIFNNAEGLLHIADGLRHNTTLQELDLNSCLSITAEGARVIAQALEENKALETLILDLNPIFDEGLAHLARALKVNSAIKMLSVADCCIGDSGIQKLGDALALNGTLCSLNVDRNEGITEYSLFMLVGCLAPNPQMKELKFPGYIDRDNVPSLIKTLNSARKRRKLKPVNVIFS